MTRKKLESVHDLQKELKMWERRLKELREDISTSSGSSDGMPGAGEPSSPTEVKAIRLVETTKAIEKKRRQIRRIIYEVTQYILSIESSETRMILQYRCVECLSWEQISERLGEGYTAENARKKYNRYMSKLK